MKQQHYLYIPGRKTLLSLFLCLAVLASFGGIALAASMPGESSAEPAETSAAVQDSSEESLPAYSITLADEGSSSDCGSVQIDGSRVTITEAGDYTVSGSLSNGQLVVGAGKESRVQLRLNGVSISSSSSSASVLCLFFFILIGLLRPAAPACSYAFRQRRIVLGGRSYFRDASDKVTHFSSISRNIAIFRSGSRCG